MKRKVAEKPTTWKELREVIARKTPTKLKNWLSAATVLIILIAIVWWLLMTASLRRILVYVSFIAFIALLVFLQIRYKRAERVIEGAFNYNTLFLFWMIITFTPIFLFYWLAPRILNRPTSMQVPAFIAWGAQCVEPALVLPRPTSMQVPAFIAWGLLLLFGSVSVFTEKHRGRVLPWLQRRIGKFAPCAYALNLLLIAWLFFSSLTYVLVSHGALRLDRPAVETSAEGLQHSAAEISADNIKEFYAWHFLQAIPLLRINETLRWKEPLTYKQGSVGLLLLLFQLMVLLPVIRAFAWYWKYVEPRQKKLRRVRRLSGQPYY